MSAPIRNNIGVLQVQEVGLYQYIDNCQNKIRYDKGTKKLLSYLELCLMYHYCSQSSLSISTHMSRYG